MKKKRREKFVRKNPKKYTKRRESLICGAMMITHRARFFFFSLNLSLFLSLRVCVCCERESERERGSRSSSTTWKTRFVLFQVGAFLSGNREKKKRDKKAA